MPLNKKTFKAVNVHNVLFTVLSVEKRGADIKMRS